MRCDEPSGLRDPRPWLQETRPESREADERHSEDDHRDAEADWHAGRPKADDTVLSGWV